MINKPKLEEEIKKKGEISEDAKTYSKKGNAYAKQDKYDEAVLEYNKAIALDPNYTDAYNNIGLVNFKLKRYNEAIQYYNKAIELNPDHYDALYNRGNAFCELKKYHKAILDYDKLIELNPSDSSVYFKRGLTFYNLQQYEKAINDIANTLKINPHSVTAYILKGNILYEQKQYYESLQDFNKAISLDSRNLFAYRSRGKTFYILNQYYDAIQDFSEAIELDPNDIESLFFRGNTYSQIKDYPKAIQDYNKAIELDPSFYGTYYNLANAFGELKMHKDATKNYKKAIELDINKEFEPYYEGIIYLKLNKIRKAAKCFNDAHISILEILVSFLEEENIEKVISHMLDEPNNAFNKIIKSKQAPTKLLGTDKEQYKKIYILVFQIIALLPVKNKNEILFAHYTKRTIAPKLIFDKNTSFRLSSILTTNDPQEGTTLLKYLNIEKQTNNQDLYSDYQAFIGCFTFNYESLNQFRLYGKEENKEATGVSIVVNKSFFSKNVDINIFSSNSSTKEYMQNRYYPLFRCIYIDPEINNVISLGHKGVYSFYKEYSDISSKRINAYNEDIDKIKDKVNLYLRELFNHVNSGIASGLNRNLICDLLLPLRYLVKHVAFKEEEECRIFAIMNLSDKDCKINFSTDYTQMYIEYQQMTEHVEKVIFAPKAEGFEIFKKALEQEGLEIECEVSSHPFS